MKPFHATVAGLVAIGGLLIAHLAMANQGGGYTGELLILDQLFAVALVVGMFAIAAGVGGRLLKAGGLRLERPLEALLFGTTAGLGTLATAIFALGWLSVRPVVLLAVLVGAAFLGRNELRELPLLVKDVLACLRARANRLSLSVFVVLVLVAISPRIDMILALYLFLVHYAVICAMESKDARFLYLSAALAGMAAGVKYNALVYLIALAPLGGWVVVVRLQQRAGAVALVLGLALATALPWLLNT